jgi:hypothetical protein
VFHEAYDFVIVPMLETIFYRFDNDKFVSDDDDKYSVENQDVVFDYEFEHEEYNQQVYQIIENKLHLNNEKQDSNNELEIDQKIQ